MRPEGWEFRLIAEMESAADREWRWGMHDCATFAGRCVEAMLGRPSIWAEYLGRHSTRIGAARVIRSAGAIDLAGLLDLRADRIPVPLARRGDVVALKVGADGEPSEDGEAALGIVEGESVVIAATVGVRRFPRSVAFAAWRAQ